MIVDLDKADLISMVIGTSPEMRMCIELTKQKLMYFSGNGWNEDWKWSKENLQLLTEQQLYALYMFAKTNN